MSEPVENGRDRMTGRFTDGNQLSRGNPSNKRMAELRRWLLECATPERVAAVEKRLYQAAMDGDVAAMRVWLEYMVGKPMLPVELTVEQMTRPEVVYFEAVCNPRDAHLPRMIGADGRVLDTADDGGPP
jgi:hypothetical protein